MAPKIPGQLTAHSALSELGLYPGTVIKRLPDVELRITHQRRVDVAYNIQYLEI